VNETFWTALQSYTKPDVFNPWRDTDVHDVYEFAWKMRTARLRLHLELPAKFLLIGEAPGYRGCHFSGIPFTCEKQLCDGIVPRIADEHRITKRELPYSEASATVIWRTLYQLNIANDTKMWNAFAWHPHVEGLPMSNRTPTPREVHDAAPLLGAVIDQFRDAKIIAVGAISSRMLKALDVGHYPVRHPSMGGARTFLEQMEKLVRG
jgi:uracil-DNA glycosylase